MTRAQNSIAEAWYTRDVHSYFLGFSLQVLQCDVVIQPLHRRAPPEGSARRVVVGFAIYSVVNERW